MPKIYIEEAIVLHQTLEAFSKEAIQLLILLLFEAFVLLQNLRYYQKAVIYAQHH